MARFTNQAQLSYNATTTNSNIVFGEIPDVITATKTAVVPTYSLEDDRITYIVSIVNKSAKYFHSLTITDNMGAYLFNSVLKYPLKYVEDSIQYYINGKLHSIKSHVKSNETLTIDSVELPGNGNVTIVYEAKTTPYAPMAVNSTITNQVTITGKGFLPFQIEEKINVENGPKLNITKSICPVPVEEGEPLTYSFIIENSGNMAATAKDKVIMTDDFNPVLKNLRVSYNNMQWKPGFQYIYKDGLFTTTEGAITVPAATHERNANTGEWITIPGRRVLTITGEL